MTRNGQSQAKPEQASLSPDLEAVLAENASKFDAKARPIFQKFAELLFARLGAARDNWLSAKSLAAIGVDTFHLLQNHLPGRPTVSVGRTALPVSQTGSAETLREVTVLVIINNDMPFLVSSVMGEVQARGLKTHLVLHPVHAARRDGNQIIELQQLDAMSSDNATSEWGAESVIVVVMDALDDSASRALADALDDVLAKVAVAVRDWKPMKARLDAAITALEQQTKTRENAGLIDETIAFCRWMRAGQFVFLGMREYRLDGEPETGSLRVIEGSGLGLLADPNVHVLRRGHELVSLNDEVRRFYLKPSPIIITKSNARSVVHRRSHMDYVGLKTYTQEGRLTGELRIVGLFTAAAYTEPALEIPFLRLKVERVFKIAGVKHATHEGRMLHNILDTFPRDELIQIGVHQLASWVPMLLQLEFDPRIRVFARRDRFDRFVSVLVFVPRDRFSTEVREDIGNMLAEVYRGRMVTHQPYFTAGPLVRVHFIIGRYEGTTPNIDDAELERRVAEITQTWEDRLENQLAAVPGAGARFSRAFPASYAENFPPERALEDIERIERLAGDGQVAIDFYHPSGEHQSGVHAAIYRFDAPIPLSDRVPILENLGFSVIDERTYRISPNQDGKRQTVSLHDMVLDFANGDGGSELEREGVPLEDAFTAVYTGRADNDLFNRLVMTASIDWIEVAMLRAYAVYMRQIGLPYDRVAVAETLVKHAPRAADLVRIFKARLDPSVEASETERKRVEQDLAAAFEAELVEVPSLDEDRILRTLLGLISATLRTNFFTRDAHGNPPVVLAFKISSRDVVDAPEPRPFREIWVSGPEVDGVHLRFAPIARGGLRWSDRAHDFRTEVLGLAKAQQVKNTVIVPQGAKGGFVPKWLPKTGVREDVMIAGIAGYKTFIRALLSLTDNLVDGQVVPPSGIVRRDGDDPYLVVAADKGTATFSDFANELSQNHNFWLGDAFASGGSAGYDHKKMGITARGAWEGVKRHFRETDHDTQTELFTVAGVGDMSGDVFGNGMLLSQTIRLVAAFDHRDIFIDPDPDAKTTFAERKRLFDLPRSSWQDYDKKLLSPGGGIFSRSAKSIALSQQMRELLGLAGETATPNEVMRAILKSKVDLFWFGGIGTYVRGDAETDADVGDRGNDAIRISAGEFGARVVGEGANLGLTQRARVDFASNGGRINTDFIDNSAGVNSSDQEVNIKIALAPALASRRLDMSARNALLVSMTEDVAHACLANNYAQTLALSLAERRGAGGTSDVVHLMQELERRGLLHRDLEALPDDAALEERAAAGTGLTRPELAVLMSYAKIALSYDLIESSVPDDTAVSDELADYFPPALQKDFASDIAAHPLRREIITTALANRMINLGGFDLPVRLASDWDLDAVGVAHAIIIAAQVTGTAALFDAISSEDNRIGGEVQLALHAMAQQQMRAWSAWLGAQMRTMPPLAEAIQRHKHTFNTLGQSLNLWLSEERIADYEGQIAELKSKGAPDALATALARAAVLAEAGDICVVADAVSAAEEGLPNASDNLFETARTYVAIGDTLRLSDLKQRESSVPAADRFDRLAINSAVVSIGNSHRTMTRAAIASGSGNSSAGSALAAWSDSGPDGPLPRTARRLSELVDSGPLTVARLTVAAAQVRDLADSLT
ncbi:MAG: NAD-glutamate dehydrogenase [Hyphomicrobiaceae bacterium]|nr:NAD-glutamate dehydrogenase [Hyphomicrobiaceae bacterium]MCC0009221.1 NAD-glutamate dehydrogenase [Hyphomicrobiaceae bacterium]